MKNYTASFMMCVALTVMNLISKESVDLWLCLQMDLNVAIFLTIAWLFDQKN